MLSFNPSEVQKLQLLEYFVKNNTIAFVLRWLKEIFPPIQSFHFYFKTIGQVTMYVKCEMF